MGVFNGWGMRITRADGTGKMPWSPTVVNIQRQKARRGKRALILGIVLALVACFACSGFWAVTQSGKAKKPPMPTPIQTIVKRMPPTPIRATPVARWTPMPGYGGMIGYRIEPRQP